MRVVSIGWIVCGLGGAVSHRGKSVSCAALLAFGDAVVAPFNGYPFASTPVSSMSHRTKVDLLRTLEKDELPPSDFCEALRLDFLRHKKGTVIL